jgi:hypothetical protein
VKKPRVSKRFDEGRYDAIRDALPSVLESIEDVADEMDILIEDWPVSISPMTTREIAQDKKVGGGHGVYLGDTQEVRLNASMPYIGLHTNLIHEIWHHVDPEATETFINSKIVPRVYEMAFGDELRESDWREFRGHRGDDDEDEGDDQVSEEEFDEERKHRDA